jgi:hypothetical protein
LWPGAPRGDIEAGGDETGVGGVEIGDTPGDAPEAIVAAGGGPGQRRGELDGDAADAKEHQPHAAPLERPVERQAQAQLVAIQRTGALCVGRHDHHVVTHRARRRPAAPARRGQRLGRRAVLDREQTHPARVFFGTA